MATIYQHLSDEQRAACADLNAGDLLLVRLAPGSSSGGGYGSGDSDDGGEFDDDVYQSDSERSQSEDEDGDESEDESEDESDEAPTPREGEVGGDGAAAVAEQRENWGHAEHIEDIDAVDHSSHEDSDNDDSASDHDSHDEPAHYPPTMFLCCDITKDSEGEVEEIVLLGVDYSATPGTDSDDTITTYQLYGNECVTSVTAAQLSKHAKIARTPSNDDVHENRTAPHTTYHPPQNFIYHVRPTGDLVRRQIFSHTCPAPCTRGWLRSISHLRGMIADYVIPSSTPNVRAVCPACMGVALTQEHQALRADLEAFRHVANFSAIVDFYAKLNPRRRELGYSFVQFDEREWGFYFDDMLSEDEEDDDGEGGADGGVRYESWDEANDPANGARLRPASAETILALKVEEYAAVKKIGGGDGDDKEGEEAPHCLVCHETYHAEKLVVVLPCGHYFCEDCGKQWLSSYDSCPACRARVPPVGDGKANGAAASGTSGQTDDSVGEHGEVAAAAGFVAVGGGDSDAVMSDTD